MSPRDSAYAALGLRPGAARSQVDEAYRRLIKLHHPDKSGGDASRAAEINRAYTLLRRERLAVGPHMHRVPMPIAPQPQRRRTGRGEWAFTVLVLAVAIGVFLTMQTGRGSRYAHRIHLPIAAAPTVAEGAAAMPLESFDEPLHSPVIDSAIAQAVKFHSAGDSSAAEIYSRDCQSTLRQQHSLVWFDACAAFDEATLTLSFGDSLADADGFEDSAVAAREMAAARVLSNDVLGADMRLHQIRSEVEFQLVPLIDSAAAQKP